MTEKYMVVWTNSAESDLINIIEYIADENVVNAKKIFDDIKECVSKLNRLPQRGRMVPELLDQGINLYRELIIQSWRMVYRISENIVYVVLVFDSRQNAEDILLKRLIKS